MTIHDQAAPPTKGAGWTPPASRTQRVQRVVRGAAAIADIAGWSDAATDEQLRKLIVSLGAHAREILLTTWCRECREWPREEGTSDGLCSSCHDEVERIASEVADDIAMDDRRALSQLTADGRGWS